MNKISKKINGDMKEAMKARDKERLSTLRMLLSELKNAEIAERGELSEEKEMQVLSSYARKLKESIAEFEKGDRDDLVAKEKKELEIVLSYLPKQLTEDEISAEVEKVIAEVGAEGPGDVGSVMREMMKRFRGRVDGKVVNRLALDMLRKKGD
ncbi:MAG: glutamyl-tRNA amidotransferase [Candidatus Latescibacteria bacterium 4484_7]|nr:MAG: glutamyl-tRNA amidotransferase [Candidatus Latescibacteria bacterium 4484_7]RKZ06188.1 MAG: GatB/YqeY domain-containing protein [bacterium]